MSAPVRFVRFYTRLLLHIQQNLVARSCSDIEVDRIFRERFPTWLDAQLQEIRQSRPDAHASIKTRERDLSFID